MSADGGTTTTGLERVAGDLIGDGSQHDASKGPVPTGSDYHQRRRCARVHEGSGRRACLQGAHHRCGEIGCVRLGKFAIEECCGPLATASLPRCPLGWMAPT